MRAGKSHLINGLLRFIASGAEYALVIDAGSTGSRIHLYKWLPEDGDRLPDIREIPLDRDCNKVNDGLSKLGGDDDTNETAGRVHDSLALLITCANLGLTDGVPDLKKIPLHLRATAGMRILRTESGDEYDKIIEAVRTYLGKTPFDIQRARVITGEEEALYAWIAANYSKGNLAKASENGTIGILELGGASAQIAFVPNDSQSEGIELVRIAGRKYQVYARGYDGIGRDKIVANFKETESCYTNKFITTAGVWGVGNYSDSLLSG